MSRDEWRRVNRRELCPVCNKPDWCLVAGPEGNPTTAICARVESDKQAGEAGWLHILKEDCNGWKPPRRRVLKVRSAAEPRADISDLAMRYRDNLDEVRRMALSFDLGVEYDALNRMGVGLWVDERDDSEWFSFPMTGDIRNGGRIVGIRLRRGDGTKISVRGGKEGLFLPAEVYCGTDRLLVLEGPTDTAATLSLGFDAVGRPSCSGGVALLVDLVKSLKPGQVVIVADGDGPGRRGAEGLASRLVPLVRDLRVIEPPEGVKDMRAWVQAGASSADVIQVIDAAPSRRMTVCSRRKGARNG